jgi:integrase
MGRKGKRKRIGRGLYEDGTGRSAKSCGKEKRFPPKTPHAEMQRWQDDTRKKYRGSGTARADRGTLAAAVDAWNDQERHLTSYDSRRAELRAWVKLYGPRRMSSLTAADVRRAIGLWSAAKVAAKTIRNRLWSLKHLYKMQGPDVETPVDHVQPPAKVRTVITPVPPERILAVYVKLLEFERTGRLRDAKTRARFMVRAATGRRPVEIMRAQPEDVDVDARTWRVRDAKGGWSEGLYLNDDMLTAWRVFREADAWGLFATDSMAEVLRAAGWPSGVRPYQLRHSLGIGLSEMGHDLADVGGWLGHTDVQTTRSAYVPILNSRMQRMAQSIDGRLAGWKVPSVPPRVPPNDAEVCGDMRDSGRKSRATKTGHRATKTGENTRKRSA